MQFSTFIRDTRIKKGLLIYQLAKKAGMTAGYVSLVEHGKKNPRIGNALRLCRALGLDVGELKKITERYKLHGAANG